MIITTHKLKPFDFRIFSTEIINVDDEYIEFQLKDKSEPIKTNIVAQFGLNSLTNFQPIKPKKGDKIFVFFEHSNEQFPVAILTGRSYLKDLDKEKLYIRAPIIRLNIDEKREDSEKFVQFDFKSSKYQFQIQPTKIELDKEKISMTTDTISMIANKNITTSANQNIQINAQNSININAKNTVLITGGSCFINISNAGITLKGLTMTLNLSGSWEIKENLNLKFIGGGKLIFDFGGENIGIPKFKNLKNFINNLITQLLIAYNSHTHISASPGNPTSPPQNSLNLPFMDDTIKSNNLILQE